MFEPWIKVIQPSMKNRIIIDLNVFNSILKELKGVRKELKAIKGEKQSKPVPVRQLDDAINTDEVLRLLKITPATLIRYDKQGLVKFHKEGRNKIYSRGEIMEFKKMKGRRKRLPKGLMEKQAS
jgi:hypothetical protein